MIRHPVHHTHDPHARSHVFRLLWQRATLVAGILMLAAGYALLAISPDTPLDWVLVRVATGFALLFAGFGLAILPWLARMLGGDDL